MAEFRIYKERDILPQFPKKNAIYLVEKTGISGTYIDFYTTDIQGVPISLGVTGGGGGTGSDTFTGIAGQILSGGRLVYLSGGKFFYYDADNENLADLPFGITKGSAALNATVQVQFSGIYTEVGLGLTSEIEYYAGINGLLTDTPSNKVITQIGIAITSDSLKIEIQPSIITV